MSEAHQILADTIENFYADQNNNGLAFTSEKMAILFVVTGKFELAARLIGWSDANRMEIGEPRPLIEQSELNQKIATIKAMIGDEAFKTAYQSGRGLTYDQAVDYVLGRKELEA